MDRGMWASREVKRRFWEEVRAGKWASDAGEAVGVSPQQGNRWFAEAGGVMEPVRRPTGLRLRAEERETIGLMRAAGAGVREVARALGRHPSTVSRELRRNAAPGSGAYRPSRAQARAEHAARREKEVRLVTHPQLRAFVEEHLEMRWSPRQIASVLKMTYGDKNPDMRVSHETIYQSLFVQSRGALRRELTGYLRTQRSRRVPQNRPARRRGRLVDPISIRERPAEAEDRAVPGHWEGDLIVGKNNGSAIGTLVERSTRFLMLIHLPGRRTAEAVAEAMIPTIAALPDQLRRSLTWDQGKEMALHQDIAVAADIDIYFCDPASPWQRGTNENTNGLCRQYFPKGISLRQFTPEDLATVAAELNARPRETLGWRTPAQCMAELLCEPFTPTVLS
jgi:transposase, IS30 family